MSHAHDPEAILPASPDDETRALVRLAGVVAAADEAEVRRAMQAASECVRPEWVEDVVLQSYLFAGFPRALNAMREWRRISGRRAPADDEGERFEGAIEAVADLLAPDDLRRARLLWARVLQSSSVRRERTQ